MENTLYKWKTATRFFTVAFLMMTFYISAEAQVIHDSTFLLFEQSRSIIDNNLHNNKSRLDSILTRLKNLEDSTTPMRPAKIRVVGGASPEGSFSFNEQLSRERADRIFDYIADDINLPDSLAIFNYLGRDWKGLKKIVENDPNAPSRIEVLEVLNEICSTDEPDEALGNKTLLNLKRLDRGVPYRYLYNKIFPSLRKSTIVVELTPLYPHLREIENRESILISPEVDPRSFMLRFPESTDQESRNFYMALKTNMLYDILAVPNLGLEFYLGKNWSIYANGMYGWWSKDESHRYWRIYGGDLGIRKWIGKSSEAKPLTGHHLGAYAGVFTFDFELGGRGIMGGLPGGTLMDRCMYVVGLEYGYSLPVGRRINIDFTVGMGYIGGKYLKYKPNGKSYLWQSTHHLNWLGPTKAEISLVWLIGNGNFNARKGGLR